LHPADFTPVCTTELGEAAKRHDEFAAKNVKICTLSCSDSDSHKAWIKDIRAVTGAEVNFPMIADPSRKYAAQLGVLDRTNLTVEMANLFTGVALNVRTVFIVKPDKTIGLMMTYPASTGRNFDEICRVIEALQLAESKGLETPVNWKPGDDAVVYFLTPDSEAESKFGEGGFTVEDVPSKKRYMRWVQT
jgi:alkyl hydroperoxide reductase subunit AhpC